MSPAPVTSASLSATEARTGAAAQAGAATNADLKLTFLEAGAAAYAFTFG